MKKTWTLLVGFYCITALFTSLVHGTSIKQEKSVILARRYSTDVGRAKKFFRNWSNSTPSTKWKEEHIEKKQKEGYIPTPQTDYERFIEKRGYKPQHMNSYEKRYRDIPLEDEESEREKIEDESEKKAVQPEKSKGKDNKKYYNVEKFFIE